MHIIKNLLFLTLTCLLFNSASYSAAAQPQPLASTAVLSHRKVSPKSLTMHGHGAGPAEQASPSKLLRRVLVQHPQPAQLSITVPNQASDQPFSLFGICKKLKDWWNTPTTDLLGH